METCNLDTLASYLLGNTSHLREMLSFTYFKALFVCSPEGMFINHILGVNRLFCDKRKLIPFFPSNGECDLTDCYLTDLAVLSPRQRGFASVNTVSASLPSPAAAAVNTCIPVFVLNLRETPFPHPQRAFILEVFLWICRLLLVVVTERSALELSLPGFQLS